MDIPAAVAKDAKFENARRYSDRKNARVESDKATHRAVLGMVRDNTQLLAFEEQGEAVLEGQLADVRHGGLFLEGLGHAREPEFVQQVEGGLATRGLTGAAWVPRMIRPLTPS